MERKKMILRKIPLNDLLNLFQYLQSKGAEFVDIVGVSNDENTQDEILIAVKDEYMLSQEEEIPFLKKFEETPDGHDKTEEEGGSGGGDTNDTERKASRVTFTKDDIINLL